ncbi:MAG: hypothetical protein WAU57_09235 [Xanthobacteraceae bacterium]
MASGEVQQPTVAQTSAIRANCRFDFMANCSAVQPGGTDAFDVSSVIWASFPTGAKRR